MGKQDLHFSYGHYIEITIRKLMYLITVKKSEKFVWNIKTTVFINPFNLLEASDNRINGIMILVQGTLSFKIYMAKKSSLFS